MAVSRSTEVFFMVDGARLEAQACLLAPTLKRHLQAGQRAVAYVRQDYRAKLEAFTIDVLHASGVEIRDIPDTDNTHTPWAAPYPHGNKILAAATPRDCDVSVFLDTDMVLAAPVDFAAELGDALIAACVSDYKSTAGEDEDWAEYYGVFGMDLPVERVQFNGGRRLTSLPYYNAGMIVFREREVDGTPTHVGRDWLDTAVTFEAKVTRNYARSNIDQFTLPILGYRRAAPVKALEQRMNFNIESFGHGEGQRQTIAHYHRLGILWAHQSHGRQALDALVEVTDIRAPIEFLENFGAHAKRNRMKHHIRAITQDMAHDMATAA